MVQHTNAGAADDLRFEVVDARSDEAVAAMTAYFDELDATFPTGFDPGDTLTADAAAFDPPTGAFVLALAGDAVAGCGGVMTIEPATCEIKRMWVDPDHRGRGVAKRLLGELERHATRLGATTVLLDTNASLHRAIAMYETAGYTPTPRYNTNPYAHHWFKKPLPAANRREPDNRGDARNERAKERPAGS